MADQTLLRCLLDGAGGDTGSAAGHADGRARDRSEDSRRSVQGLGWALPGDWGARLGDTLREVERSGLMAFVDGERTAYGVGPHADPAFRAFRLTSYEDTRAVIVGQDPYHGPGKAHGLCFSVSADLRRRPPSLSNILKELKDDVGVELTSGNLEGWARQGVLLLNTTLSIRSASAGSHRGEGWERFIDGVLRALDRKEHRVVFLLWGSQARRRRPLITSPVHRVIESAHPSPMSANRGFFGSRPFSRTNQLLTEVGLPPVDWSRAG